MTKTAKGIDNVNDDCTIKELQFFLYKRITSVPFGVKKVGILHIYFYFKGAQSRYSELF